MPEVGNAEVEEMSDDEVEEAVEQAVDEDKATDEEVMGFAPRDS